MSWRHWCVVVFLIGLSACTSSDDETVVPSPLPEVENTLNLRPLWRRSTDAENESIASTMVPAIDDGRVFVAGSNGVVSAYQLADGKPLWSVELNLSLRAGVAAGDGLVVVSGTDGDVIALNAETGEVAWRSLVSSEVISPAAIGEEAVVVRTNDGKLFAFAQSNGKRLWFYDKTVPVLTLRGTSQPIIAHGAVICGFDTGKISLFLLKDGRLIWEHQIAKAVGRSELERIVDMDTKPLLVGEVVYAVSYNGNLVALDLRSGRPIWQREMSAYQDLATDGRRLFVATADDTVRAVDRMSGATLWNQPALKYRQITAPVYVGDYVVVGDFEGYLHWMDVSDGHFVMQYQIDSDGFAGPLATSGRYLIAQSRDGEIVVFEAPEPTYK